MHDHSCGERRQYLHLVQKQIPLVLLVWRFSRLRSRRLGDNVKLTKATRFRRVMKLFNLRYLDDAILLHVPYLDDIIIKRNFTFNGLPDSFWNNCIGLTKIEVHPLFVCAGVPQWLYIKVHTCFINTENQKKSYRDHPAETK